MMVKGYRLKVVVYLLFYFFGILELWCFFSIGDCSICIFIEFYKKILLNFFKILLNLLKFLVYCLLLL